MKIIIITQDEPFYLPFFFSEIKELFKKYKITVIVLPTAKTFGGFLKIIKKHYDLYGLFLFLRQGFKFVLCKILNLIGNILPSEKFYSVISFLKRNEIHFFKIKNIKEENSLKKIKKICPDLIISVASPQIFPERLLEIPQYGCINIHQALLPRYRGINPSFWVLLNNESETGVSVHFMDEKIDNGPILLQKKVKISPQETLHSLYLKNIKIGARLLKQAVFLIKKGIYKTIPNPEEKATYFSFPDKKSARKFQQSGKKFF